jgi:hypothetical protein
MRFRLIAGLGLALAGIALIAVLLSASDDSSSPSDPCGVPEPPRRCFANYVPGVPNIDRATAVALQVWGSRYGDSELDRSGETTVLRLYVEAPTAMDRARYAAKLGPPAEHIEIEPVTFSADEIEHAADEAHRVLQRYDAREYSIETDAIAGRIVVGTPRPLPPEVASEIAQVSTVPVRFRRSQLQAL